MTEAATIERVRELMKIIGAAPSQACSAQAGPGTYEPALLDSERSLAAHMDALRVQLRYLLFDLEATRRENRYLRQMLQSRRPGGSSGEDDASS